MKVAVYLNPNKFNKELEDLVIKKILSKGLKIDNDNPDVVLFVGGDGTFLKAIHQYIDRLDSLIFAGVNAGHLGFFYEFDINQLDNLLDLIIKNEYKIEKFNLLEGTLIKENTNIKVFGLNEIRIENPFKTLTCDVKIDDTYLETFRGNGLLVTSSIGSSAYNKSIGGAIIEGDLPLIELSEICPIHNNEYHSLGSSLILSKDKEVSIEGDIKRCVIGYDNKVVEESGFDKIKIKLSDKSVKCVKSNNYSYIESLKRCFIK